jgi:hypothetical protein
VVKRRIQTDIKWNEILGIINGFLAIHNGLKENIRKPSIAALKVPFDESFSVAARNHGDDDAVSFLSPVRAGPTIQGSLMSLNQSLRLEDL